MSKMKLGKLAGVSPAYVWHLETGRIENPGAQTLCGLASALGVGLDDLVSPAVGPEAGTTDGATREAS